MAPGASLNTLFLRHIISDKQIEYMSDALSSYQCVENQGGYLMDIIFKTWTI